MKKMSTTNRNSIYRIQVKLTEDEYRKFQEDYAAWHPADSENEKLKSESNYFRHRYMSGELLRRGAPRGNQNAKRNEVDSANSVEVTSTNLEKINNFNYSTDPPAILTNKDVRDSKSASLKNADDTLNKNCGNTENEETNFPSGYDDAAEKREAGKVGSQNVFSTILDEEFETLIESIGNFSVVNPSARLRDESEFAAKQDSPQQVERENEYPFNKIPFNSVPSPSYEADANDDAATTAAENNSTKKTDYQPKLIIPAQPSLF